MTSGLNRTRKVTGATPGPAAPLPTQSDTKKPALVPRARLLHDDRAREWHRTLEGPDADLAEMIASLALRVLGT